jgi:hypothetical protein
LQVLYNDRKAIDWLPVIIYYEISKASHHPTILPSQSGPFCYKTGRVRTLICSAANLNMEKGFPIWKAFFSK